MKVMSCLLVAAALAANLCAHAAPLVMRSQGVFNNSAPPTTFSAPGASWSFSLVIDSNPQPLLNDGLTKMGLFSTVPFDQFTFLLNGLPVPGAHYLSLYNAGNLGGMDLFFSDIVANPDGPPSALSFPGPQLFLGPESSPTIVPGNYVVPESAGGMRVAFGGAISPQGLAHINIGAVPEPATGLMWLGALSMAALRRWFSIRRH